MTAPALVWQHLDPTVISPERADVERCSFKGCRGRPAFMRGPSRPELGRAHCWQPYCRVHAAMLGVQSRRGRLLSQAGLR